MASCEHLLPGLLKEIEPTATQKNGGRRSHTFLREILDTGNMSRAIVDSYLSGSYARDTAIKPLEDIDIIFLVDPRHWPTSLFSNLPEPDAVLKTFLNAIRYRYKDSSLRLQSKSVGLRLNHLHIDAVPAIDRGRNDSSIWIPDRKKEGWIVSAPKIHTTIATDINQRHNGRFKPLVKLLKFWNNCLPSTARFKSFAIETIASRVFQRTKLHSLEDGLLLFFDFIASFGVGSRAMSWGDNFGVALSWLECEVRDLANTGSNVVASVDEERRSRFLDYAAISRDRMLQARTARSMDAAWKRLCEALRC